MTVEENTAAEMNTKASPALRRVEARLNSMLGQKAKALQLKNCGRIDWRRDVFPSKVSSVQITDFSASLRAVKQCNSMCASFEMTWKGRASSEDCNSICASLEMTCVT